MWPLVHERASSSKEGILAFNERRLFLMSITFQRSFLFCIVTWNQDWSNASFILSYINHFDTSVIFQGDFNERRGAAFVINVNKILALLMTALNLFKPSSQFVNKDWFLVIIKRINVRYSILVNVGLIHNSGQKTLRSTHTHDWFL